jgi:hypothetical protein
MSNLKYFLEENKKLTDDIKICLKKVGKTQVELSLFLGMSNTMLNSFLSNKQRIPAVHYIKIVKYLKDARENLKKENYKE